MPPGEINHVILSLFPFICLVLFSAEALADPIENSGAASAHSSFSPASKMPDTPSAGYRSSAGKAPAELPRTVPEMAEDSGQDTALPVKNEDVVLAANRALALMNEDLKACRQQVGSPPPSPPQL